ncbi:MAG: imidazolonepropionase [Crenarchaeota archaeon]|nr:imidazolonepropionase [Thermoproteota archaeon]MCR8454192.1 imidazolonepropionase [Thermoproteota archaeon]MCR8455592.1 imidazolonepropionase [Thermoproteota archaeon]MCR8463182.1 imidazolonepropionase [Thermoproteota archaeon]MCR8470573.1 imidazolonepropionase [Thermoproteota archaeon]
MHVDILIINANEVLTLSGYSERPKVGRELKDLGIIPDGAVAILDGKILEVGKTNELIKKYDADLVIDASNKIVLPGFVDPHTHLVFAGSREEELTLKLEGVPYLEILKRGGGILKTVRLTRDSSESELFKEAYERLNTALVHGTTTIEAKSGYGLDTKNEIKILKVIKRLNEDHFVDVVPTFLGAHAIPPEFKDDPDGYVNLIINEMIPAVAKDRLAVFNDVFVEEGVFTVEQGRRILVEGKTYNLIPKVHADEFNDLGGAQLAAEVNAISADHLLYSSENGLREMAKKGVIGVLLPATSMTLMGMKFADARKIIDLGVPVALATDLNPNCWIENMQFVITLAVYFLKMTPAEAISAATINAAHAIGLGKYIGSIEKGKQADVLIMNIPSSLFVGYKFGSNLVEYLIKNGELIIQRGRIIK